MILSIARLFAKGKDNHKCCSQAAVLLQDNFDADAQARTGAAEDIVPCSNCLNDASCPCKVSKQLTTSVCMGKKSG